MSEKMTAKGNRETGGARPTIPIKFFSETIGAEMGLSQRLDRMGWGNGQRPAIMTRDEAEALLHWELFDTIYSIQGTWASCDNLPIISTEVAHFIVPHCYDQHQNFFIHGQNIESWVTETVNKNLTKRKYILSCDINRFIAFSVEDFSYDQIDFSVDVAGHDAQFIVFSSEKKFWVSFYPRSPFIIISIKGDAIDFLDTLGYPREFIVRIFNENYEKAFSLCSQSFREHFWRTYAPRVRVASDIPRIL
ncbi:hypothetical protein [Stagnihabitans tardus]|uniref:Uncharacterized protein n=1 Tax=Stagnihabitans tardus TaxID=2699202 RepID=A0AAE5BWL7_9RHOB|nr:hypothetical protein [Stagnihabitans tardus]NBZ90141.1 hypothetical protein [Stagnihabitans tardus]